MPRGDIINSQARQFVLHLIDYFQREKDNGGPLLPLTSIRERVSSALGISMRNVSRIKEEGRLLEDRGCLRSSSISTSRVQGLQLQLRTRNGDISVESSYCDKSEFVTHNGNLLLSNVHKDCKLNIHETGSLKMTGFNGKLDAFIKHGTADIQLSEISNDSNLTIEDEGKLVLRISEECQDDTSFDITSRCIMVDENVRFIKCLVKNIIYLTPLNDVACKSFIIHCNKSEVTVKSASWAEMLFAEKMNKI